MALAFAEIKLFYTIFAKIPVPKNYMIFPDHGHQYPDEITGWFSVLLTPRIPDSRSNKPKNPESRWNKSPIQLSWLNPEKLLYLLFEHSSYSNFLTIANFRGMIIKKMKKQAKNDKLNLWYWYWVVGLRENFVKITRWMINVTLFISPVLYDSLWWCSTCPVQYSYDPSHFKSVT